MSDANSHGVVLFDGSCVFCQRSVMFIADRDPAGYFRFGASQAPAGERILREHGIDRAAARSIVLIEDGQAYLRSTASLRIVRRLRFPWNLLGVFLFVPRPLRDAVYGVVAALRHRIAGTTDVCAAPSATIRERSID
jgi:predicted DCC family thiol-disulfide oxidoreductase YuxK